MFWGPSGDDAVAAAGRADARRSAAVGGTLPGCFSQALHLADSHRAKMHGDHDGRMAVWAPEDTAERTARE